MRDIVAANLLVMEDARADFDVLNVGTGRSISIADIARLLGRLYGVALEPDIVKKYRAGDIRHCYADITKIRALGFQPSVTLEQGMAELVAWGRSVEASDRVEDAARELESHGLTRG